MAVVRCYKCGRVRCETCGGRGHYMEDRCTPPPDMQGESVMVDCPDCKDGWREASIDVHGSVRPCPLRHYVREDGECVILGTDPAVLCPACQEEVNGE